MDTHDCTREAALLVALRHGQLTADDERHLASCASCTLAADAERWMAAAAETFATPHLPSAGSLLLRAQLRARREAAERSLRPLRAWRQFAGAAGAAVAVLALTRGELFFAALWTASPTPAEALFAAGTLALASLPIWLRLRRERV